ncbi:MAG: hypothetical protein PHT38_05425, partial [Halothiobacillus sp.]|nr:hypothetical protein [Halothiobacillus sp.]
MSRFIVQDSDSRAFLLKHSSKAMATRKGIHPTTRATHRPFEPLATVRSFLTAIWGREVSTKKSLHEWQ